LAEAVIYPADVRDARAMQAVAEDFMRRHGCPDIVIANAGVSRRRVTQFFEDSKVFEAILATNVLGIVDLFHPYLTAMRASGHGVLVGVASIGGYRGLPTGGGAYSASKAAAISYLESLRAKMHGSGVSVITVCGFYQNADDGQEVLSHAVRYDGRGCRRKNRLHCRGEEIVQRDSLADGNRCNDIETAS
jgi:NAD(P)-dependent dehydrogenase (short-subunit alcohol dehydrogenase family)